MKTINIHSGTDILICSPSHPYLAVQQARQYVERIQRIKEDSVDVNINCAEAIEALSHLAEASGMKCKYALNGCPSTLNEVMKDLQRGKALLEEIKSLANIG